MDNLTDAISEQLISNHLRTDIYADEREYIVGVLLPAAWDFCSRFVNRDVYPNLADMAAAIADPVLMTKAPMVYSPAFRAAVLLVLGHLYRNRESVADSKLIELPLGARALLWPLRANLGV